MAASVHVVMLPWLAFGHLIPYFRLSLALAEAGVRVSFVSTPRNIQRLPEIPPNLAPLINFVRLPLPAIGDGSVVPKDAEATVDLTTENDQGLKLAYDFLKNPINQYVADHSPDWIICDFCPYWAVEIARDHGASLLHFPVISATVLVFFGRPGRPLENLTSPPAWFTFPSTVAYRDFEVTAIRSLGSAEYASGISDMERYGKILNGCQAIAVRSCFEFEGEYLNLCTNIMGKPVIPVGLLPDLENPERQEEEEEEEEETKDGPGSEIFKWLGEQKPKSVVFVGFGSECKLTRDQVHEIAYGLQLSELPFLWALRKPHWAIEDADVLPSGFTDRTSGKGIVFMGWAPQVKILAHPSIGGSLFHSGWGSAIETLQFGHPLVVLPLILDQGLNARLLVEKGLALEIERAEDGSFSRDDIAKSLKLAMVAAEGETLRARAREAASILRDGKLHQDYVGGFVEYLKKNIGVQMQK